MKKKTGLLFEVLLFGLVVFGFAVFGLIGVREAWAQSSEAVCAVYFTGVGCSHCAKSDPVVLETLLEENPSLVIIEYEIYQHKENAPLLYEYNESYDSGLGIPLLIFGKDDWLIGDRPIINNADEIIRRKKSNSCPLADGSAIAFEDLDATSLPGQPKVLTEVKGEVAGARKEKTVKDLTLAKILSLAAVDAVNPCALAVLVLMLVAILTYNPRKKSRVLLAGLSFSLSVFIMYLFYGLVIIKFFQLVQALTSIRFWLYKILGLVAVVLGVLNMKDFFAYKPGGLGTEMPMKLRPKMKKIISGITSPKGAFGVGAFVTVFLLPCTIGPYVICGGILSSLDLVKTLPWLLIYNFIFVLPMIVVTAACYVGFTTVENVSSWRDKNIRYLHLVAGLIILGLGLAMFFGLV